MPSEQKEEGFHGQGSLGTPAVQRELKRKQRETKDNYREKSVVQNGTERYTGHVEWEEENDCSKSPPRKFAGKLNLFYKRLDPHPHVMRQ